MAVTQKPDGRWCVYYRVRGADGKSRVKWESFGRGATAEARAYARDAELGLLRRRPRQETCGPSVLELAKEYRDKRGFNANSKKQLDIRIAAHLAPAFGATPALRLKSADVDAYVEARRAAGAVNATIARELTDLKAILNWSVKRDPPLIPHNPIANYRKPRAAVTAAQPPTRAEAVRILNCALPHVRRAMLLSWHLGLRPQGELLALTWESVRWESRRILVVSSAKGGPAAREVPIHPKLLPALRKWHASDRRAGHRHRRDLQRAASGPAADHRRRLRRDLHAVPVPDLRADLQLRVRQRQRQPDLRFAGQRLLGIRHRVPERPAADRDALGRPEPGRGRRRVV